MALRNGPGTGRRPGRGALSALLGAVLLVVVAAVSASAQEPGATDGAATMHAAPVTHGGGEANLVIPDLSASEFLGTDGRSVLLLGLVICALGLAFSYFQYVGQRKLPVHRSM